MTNPLTETAANLPTLRKLHLAKPEFHLLYRDKNSETSHRFAPTHTCIWQFTVLFRKKVQNRPMSAICKSGQPFGKPAFRYLDNYSTLAITSPNKRV